MRGLGTMGSRSGPRVARVLTILLEVILRPQKSILLRLAASQFHKLHFPQPRFQDAPRGCTAPSPAPISHLRYPQSAVRCPEGDRRPALGDLLCTPQQAGHERDGGVTWYDAIDDWKRGLRLDYAFVSAGLARHVSHARIDVTRPVRTINRTGSACRCKRTCHLPQPAEGAGESRDEGKKTRRKPGLQ